MTGPTTDLPDPGEPEYPAAWTTILAAACVGALLAVVAVCIFVQAVRP